MIVLIGTVPYDTGVYLGEASIQGRELLVDGNRFSVERGTAAMAAACVQVCRFFGLRPPVCIFGGDVADGRGTNLMFQSANAELDSFSPEVICLHYMFPKIAYGEPFMQKVLALPKRPRLIADAGGMYLMKTVHQARGFDFFTPDEGELYFLADETAPHPLYVRRELLEGDRSVEKLIARAYREGNTAKVTVLKGATDRVYLDGVPQFELSAPNIPAMEPVGGTGDTITGMLTAFVAAGDTQAAGKALTVNRLIGRRIRCTPATQIADFIEAMPRALEEYEKKAA